MRPRIKPAHALVCVLLVALVLRAALLLAWYQLGRGGEIAGDSVNYVEIARDLVAGEGFGDEARRPPLYPALLAPMLRVPSFPLSVQLLQVLLGALSCGVLFLLGRDLVGRVVGLLAAAMLALHYYSARQAAAVLPETLYLLLELVAFWLLVRAWRRRSRLELLLAGVALGLATLTKEVLIYLVPLLCCWPLVWGEGRRRGLANGLVFLAGVLLVVAPWVARNSLIAGKLVPITASAGHSVWVGNNPTSTGGRTGGDWELHVDVRYKPDPERPPMWTPEADRYLAAEGLRFILDNPGRFLELSWRRVVNMWRPYQLDSPWPAKVATTLSYLPVLLLGLPGLWLSRREWRGWLPVYMVIGYTSLVHAVTISGIRYRYPLMPFLMLAAALSLTLLWRRWRGAPAREDAPSR